MESLDKELLEILPAREGMDERREGESLMKKHLKEGREGVMRAEENLEGTRKPSEWKAGRQCGTFGKKEKKGLSKRQ